MVTRDLKRQLEDPRYPLRLPPSVLLAALGAYVPKGLDVVGTVVSCLVAVERKGQTLEGVLSGHPWLGCNNQEAVKITDDPSSTWAMSVGLSLSKGKA